MKFELHHIADKLYAAILENRLPKTIEVYPAAMVERGLAVIQAAIRFVDFYETVTGEKPQSGLYKKLSDAVEQYRKDNRNETGNNSSTS